MKSFPVTALALFLALPPLAMAENGDGKAPPTAEAKPDEPKPDEAAALVEGKPAKELVPLLGHARYKVRQAAEDRLKDLVQDETEPVEEVCYDAYLRDPDPEVRMRARGVLLSYVARSGFAGGRGYVGIRLHLHAYYDTKGDLRFGVKVNQVEPGTPASKVGMLAGDLVTAVDAVDLNNPDGDRKFMDYVARKPPGKQIVMVLDRAGQEVKQPVVLARRPLELLSENTTSDPESLFRDYLRKKEAEKQPAPPPPPAAKEKPPGKTRLK